MVEINFPCPQCSTELRATPEHAGVSATCPKCNKQLEVPGPQEVKIPGVPPKISAVHEQNYKDHDVGVTLRSKNCTLAYVSFFLVCISIFTGGILIIPGLICGHMAVKQCERDTNLVGKSWAVAALRIGYILIGIGVLIVIGLAFLMVISS